VATRNQHIAWIGQHLRENGVAECVVREQAEAALQMFLESAETEVIEFGNPDYFWNKAAAKVTAEEYLQSLAVKEAA
jgi:hypothetical protein